MHRPHLLLLALLLAGTGFLSTASAAGKKQVTGIYSNMSYSREGGDVVGTEVFVLYEGSTYKALVQCAGGPVGEAQLLPAVVSYPEISFVIPPDSPTLCPKGEYKGKISPKGLKGSIQDHDWPGFLPRKKSYWQ